MIRRLADICSNYIIENSAASKKDKEIYEFGMKIIISSFVGIIGVLLIGLCSKTFSGSLVFILAFCLLRTKAGGYHAPNSIICNASFIGTYSIITIFYKSINHLSIKVVICCLILAFMIVMFLAPIGTPNNPIPECNVNSLKIKSCLTFLVILALGVLMAKINMGVAYYTIMALYVNSIAVLLGFIVYKKKGEQI